MNIGTCTRTYQALSLPSISLRTFTTTGLSSLSMLRTDEPNLGRWLTVLTIKKVRALVKIPQSALLNMVIFAVWGK